MASGGCTLLVPTNDIAWQEALNDRYARIECVAQKTSHPSWLKAIEDLRNQVICPPPWWWKVATYKKKVIASVVHPPILANSVFIFSRFWEKPLYHQCSTLIHEWVHVVQRREGRLSYWKYITNQDYQNAIELEARNEQTRFRLCYKSVYHA